MKFNKSGKDNIIKMSNNEAKEVLDSIDELCKHYINAYSDNNLFGENTKTFLAFVNGIRNLSEIGPQD